MYCRDTVCLGPQIAMQVTAKISPNSVACTLWNTDIIRGGDGLLSDLAALDEAVFGACFTVRQGWSAGHDGGASHCSGPERSIKTSPVHKEVLKTCYVNVMSDVCVSLQGLGPVTFRLWSPVAQKGEERHTHTLDWHGLSDNEASHVMITLHNSPVRQHAASDCDSM